MEDYRVIDEDDLGQIEMELENEAWDNYGRADFTSALREAATDPDAFEDWLDTHTVQYPSEALDRANVYPEHASGGSVYWDWERVAPVWWDMYAGAVETGMDVE